LLTSQQAVLTIQSQDQSARALQKMKPAKRKLFESGKFYRGSPRFRKSKKPKMIRVAMVGANSEATIEPLDELPGKSNYFVGNDPSKWLTGIPTFRRVKYVGIYPGIDLLYYGRGRQLEFDFVVEPGADPSEIGLRVKASGQVVITKNGDLRVNAGHDSFELHCPESYQVKEDGTRLLVAGKFVQRGDGVVGIQLGKYDPRRQLIIDPALAFSTYLGGNGTDDASGIAVDPSGNSYIVGQTTSTNLPTVNEYPASASADGIAFISKLSSDGSTLLYSTYLGGTGGEVGNGIALDPNENVYVTGYTLSSDFPIVNGFQTATGTTLANAFVARIDTAQSGTSSLVYSTYLGGGGNSENPIGDVGFGIAADSSGLAYVTGQTTSDASAAPFPTTAGAYQASLASQAGNAFLTVVDTNQAGAESLVYSTYLGGSSSDFGDYGLGVTVDGLRNAYLVGTTTSATPIPFPTTSSAYQASLNSSSGNAFVTEIATPLTGAASLVYSTYLGGSGEGGDFGLAITLDSLGGAYVSGGVSSADFPVTSGAYQTVAYQRAFVAKMDLTQSGTQSLVYSTFLGGTIGDEARGISVDAGGNAVVAGTTASGDFPTTSDALQATLASPFSDAFLSKLNATGTVLLYSTYFGGSCANGDSGNAVALDISGNAYIAGSTCSSDLPISPSNAYQTSLSGTQNAFVAKVVLPSPTPVSIALNPQNPSPALGSTQQFSAIGTYSDSTTRDLTTSVAWSSSDTSTMTISNDRGTQGFGVTLAVGAATITATLGSVSGNTGVTVSSAVASTIPTITDISPNSGGGGTQVTVTGSGFGAAQGSGYLWLGSTIGTVTEWRDTQVVAFVAPASTSGTVQVVQGGVSSNTFSFTVNTPTITNLSTATGVAGTPVTITGSNFGASQGSGQVRLGSTNGIVSSWHDTQILATVATGASSGAAQVLQNGVWSNAVAFTVNRPQITSINPTSGPAATVVTIDGTGFGASQGSGSIWIGSTNGIVTGWGDTEVTATVASTAVSGIVRVQQNGAWSNSENFTVTGNSGSSVTLNPSLINMVVGDTRTIQALNAQGQSVTGLTWSSTDTTVASLSTDEPPIITALAAGHVTILADSGSADVTVVAGASLPVGTVQWSNSGDGSGVIGIVPAVPSTSGVDVFAFQASGSVAAIRTDGTTAWTADVSSGYAVADFLGGLVYVTPTGVRSLDANTGQPNPAHTFTNFSPSTVAVGTDGTIYAVDGDALVGINPSNGSVKLSVPMDDSSSDSLPFCEFQVPHSGVGPPAVYQLMIAGDGNAYVLYSFSNQTSDPQIIDDCNASFSHIDTHLRVLRVSPTGSYAKISLGDWAQDNSVRMEFPVVKVNGVPRMVHRGTSIQAGFVPGLAIGALLTNSDTGVVVSWSEQVGSYCASEVNTDPKEDNVPAIITGGCVAANTVNRLATLTGNSLSTSATTASLLTPSLQRADGTFVGSDQNGNMVAFDASGGLKWGVPGFSPLIATEDDGLIAQSFDGQTTSTFDQDGNANGQTGNLPRYSWKNAYQLGSVEAVLSIFPAIAPNYGAVQGGNLTGNGTAAVHHTIGIFICGNPPLLSGTCAGRTDADGYPLLDLGFYYAPFPVNYNGSGVPLSPSYDFTADHQDWDNVVIDQIFRAAIAAFKPFPVIVVGWGTQTTTQPSLFGRLIGQTSTTTFDQDHIALISGNIFTRNGLTFQGLSPSSIYYGTMMNGAQAWLQLTQQLPSDASQNMTPQQAAAFRQMLIGIGKGIGNVVAHEIGHQYSLPFMDCDDPGDSTLSPPRPAGPPCPADPPHNILYEYYQAGPPTFLDAGLPLKWSPPTTTSLRKEFLTK
jgi:hypothetical protein